MRSASRASAVLVNAGRPTTFRPQRPATPPGTGHVELLRDVWHLPGFYWLPGPHRGRAWPTAERSASQPWIPTPVSEGSIVMIVGGS